MKTINNYISEKLNISTKYSCQPKTKEELENIIKERLDKDKNTDLNDIDVFNITDMSYVFTGTDPHNIDISKWDVSNVTDTSSMFYCCYNFNADLSDWNVSNVKNINCIFIGCSALKNKPSWSVE